MPRAPVLTLSGYPKRDAYRAFDAALAERDAERACCLAAELACTPREPRALASHLVDVFAEAYATLDPRAVVRLAGALARFQPGAREERRALCEAVMRAFGLRMGGGYRGRRHPATKTFQALRELTDKFA